MAAFAILDDLAAIVGPITGVDATNRASMLLEMATSAIQDAAKQHIFHVTDDEVELDGVWGKRLLLPERPVTDVGTVSLRDPAGVEVPLIEGTDWVHNRRALLRIGFISRLPRPTPGFWGGPDSTITVTYSHGYATILQEIRDLTVEVAARAWPKPGGIRQESIGAYAATYDGPGVITLTEDDRQRLHDYRALARS